MDRDPAKARQELLQRPTLEDEVTRLTAVQGAVRDALTAELGLDRWTELNDPSRAGCADFADLDAETVFLPGLLLTGGVPDAQWPAAVDIVVRVAGRGGFGPPETVVDNPGQHEVVLRGERGSLLTLGTLANATLSLEAGCHLPAAVRGAG